MFREHTQIVLTDAVAGDFGEAMLPGDVGVIIHVHPEGAAFVVEFLALDGDTAVIATVLPSQARPVTGRDMTHARPLAAAS